MEAGISQNVSFCFSSRNARGNIDLWESKVKNTIADVVVEWIFSKILNQGKEAITKMSEVIH